MSVVALDKFARKPFEVSAIEITEENQEELCRLVEGEIRFSGKEDTPDDKRNPFIWLTNEKKSFPRARSGYVGDFLVQFNSSWRVYTASAFANSFAPVE